MDCLLNPKSGVLHRWPAWESCNVDAIPLEHRITGFEARLVNAPAFKRRCKRCFPAP